MIHIDETKTVIIHSINLNSLVMMNNDSNFVKVPIATLNALKGLLFNSEDGVDLSPIIDDLGGDEVTAINVGLVFKGIKPVFKDIELPRIEYKQRFTYKSFSLIRNIVIATDDSGRIHEFRLDDWRNLPIDNHSSKFDE